MPAAFERNDRGKVNFVHTCEVCGKWASYGYSVQLRKAMALGDPKKAGRWFCQEHRPVEDDHV